MYVVSLPSYKKYLPIASVSGDSRKQSHVIS